MIAFCVLFLITLSILPRSTEENSLSPGKKPMLFVGIFQEGFSGSSYCQSAIRINNDWKEQLLDSVIRKLPYFDNLMISDDITYSDKTFTGVDQLANIILDLKLNQSYFVDNELEQHPTWNRLKIKSWRTSSRIMIVFLYADEQETQFASQLLYGENYLVIQLNQDNMDKVDNGNIHSSNDFLDTNAKKLMSYIVTNQSRETDYFIVVHIINGDKLIYEMEFDYFYNNYVMKYYKEFQICHILYRLNISDGADINNFEQRLENDLHLGLIIVYGDPQDQIKLFNHRNRNRHIKKRIWVFHDLRKHDFPPYTTHIYPGTIFSLNSENYDDISPAYLNNLLRFIKFELKAKTDLSQQAIRTIQGCSDAYNFQILRMAKLINLYSRFDLFIRKTFTSYKIGLLKTIKNRKGNTRIPVRFGHIKEHFHDLKIELYDNIKCPIPYCGSGKERYFGKIADNNFLWNNSFGWTCKQCAADRYKSIGSLDNSSCIQCPTLMITKEDQSGCFNPYTDIFLEFNDIAGLITLGICGTGFIFSLFNLIILFKFHNTPFVKAFDFPKLVRHLLFMLFSFGFYPYLFIGKPSDPKCFLQPVSILILSICPSIIILLKSQNVLLVFKSKLRLSKGEKMRSTGWQAMIASLIVVTDVAVIYLLMREGLPIVIQTYDHQLYTRHIHCNNGRDINIQIAYLIVLQLLTSVQAFRGRNLPGPFNEGLSIAFSTFVLVITETVQFPMYYLQQDIKLRSSVHAVVLSVSHFLFMVIYYGSKMHLLFFKRKENTQEHSRNQRVKKLSSL